MRICEIDGFFVGTIFFFKFGQRPGIKGTDRAGFDAVRQLAFQVSIQAVIALTHFGTLIGAELRRVIRAGFQALDVTFFVAQTDVAVHKHDSIFGAPLAVSR